MLITFLHRHRQRLKCNAAKRAAMVLAMRALILFLTFASFVTLAMSDELKPGEYKKISGNQFWWCDDFVVTDQDLSSGTIEIGARLFISLNNSDSETPSDLSPQCLFRERVRRTQNPGVLFITQENSEVCKGQLVSETRQLTTIRAGSLEVDVRDSSGSGFRCAWRKAGKK